jgi:hypothetical protein
MQDVYGVVSNGAHVDVSNTLLGAKQYATRNGYTVVTLRHNAGHIATKCVEKINGKWLPYNPISSEQ